MIVLRQNTGLIKISNLSKYRFTVIIFMNSDNANRYISRTVPKMIVFRNYIIQLLVVLRTSGERAVFLNLIFD